MSNLDKEFLKKVKEPLMHLGFKKESEGTYIYSIDDNFCGWLGLNRSTQYADILLFPLVGLSSRLAIKLFHKLRGRRPKRTILPITMIPLSNLTGEKYDPKWICSSEDILKEVDNMSSFIKLDAIPYMQKNATFECIVNLMVKHNQGHPQRAMYLIPICYHLLKQNQKAIEYAYDKNEKFKNENHLLAENYKIFFSNFLKYLEDGSLPPISSDWQNTFPAA